MAKYHIALVLGVVLLLLSSYTSFGYIRHLTQEEQDKQWEEILAEVEAIRSREVASYPINLTLTEIKKAEQVDEMARRSLAEAATNPDPTAFLHLLRIYYHETYFIHPKIKLLVQVKEEHVNPLQMAHRYYLWGDGTPVIIPEADWRRYEAAVERPLGLLITSVDVWKCRLWLAQNSKSTQ